MAGSHSGEDLHVRTLQAHVPADRRQPGRAPPRQRGHAARRADGGPARARWRAAGRHPAHVLRAARDVPAPGTDPRLVHRRVLAGRAPDPGRGRRGRRARVRDDAREALGRDTTAAASRRSPSHCTTSPARTPSSPTRSPCRRSDPRAALAPSLTIVRDAMLAHPEMVAGTRERLDTSVMKALPGRIVAKTGAEGLRAYAILPGPRARAARRPASGLALKIEDGGSAVRGPRLRRSRRSPRRACSTARRCASSVATTARSRPTRTAGRRPRRSRRSSSRRSASCWADSRAPGRGRLTRREAVRLPR